MPLLLSEMEPVLEALAPELREVVGLADRVELPLCVLLGVLAPVPVPDCVPLPVGVPLGLWLAVALLLSEMEPVLEALAPAEREGVLLPLTVLLLLTVEEGVGAAVPVPDCVPLPVGVPL